MRTLLGVQSGVQERTSVCIEERYERFCFAEFFLLRDMKRARVSLCDCVQRCARACFSACGAVRNAKERVFMRVIVHCNMQGNASMCTL